MANWQEKIKATERIWEIVEKKDCAFEIFGILKKIQEIDVKVCVIEALYNGDEILEEKLGELQNEILEKYENLNDSLELNDKIEIKNGDQYSKREAYENFLEYSENLKDLIYKIENKFVHRMEDWSKNLESKDLKIKEKIAAKELLKLGLCQDAIETLLVYKGMIPEMFKLYEAKMYEMNKEPSAEMKRLDAYLCDVINEINEVHYGNVGYT